MKIEVPGSIPVTILENREGRSIGVHQLQPGLQVRLSKFRPVDQEIIGNERGLVFLCQPEERPIMIDTLKSDFPVDMARAASFPAMGTLDHLAEDAMDHLKAYAREKPISFGLWALGIGFVLGWKLKPW